MSMDTREVFRVDMWTSVDVTQCDVHQGGSANME
jgi:hypothetical protein